MASLRDIRKRIKSVKSSEKITKAMKMVAAAKLRRAQDEVRKSKTYARRMDEVVGRIAKRLELQGQAAHPLLEIHESLKRVEILVLTSERGLCGAFNSNIIRRSQRFLAEKAHEHDEIRVSTLGQKGFEALKREGVKIRKNYTDILNRPSYLKASEIAEELASSYLKDHVDSVYIIYNEFKSAISQQVILKQILPIVSAKSVEDPVDYLYEPSQTELLEHLLPKHLTTQLYQACLESVASEHGARMTAMENATRNAKDVISTLTLQYNRARQTSITKELMEIIGGAEALT
ncbi:MAG: ATP synthase F1 subunit gamma [Myxococcaceae bacterium]|nr:ATP synthase F1 subunit gamma [Myxococcaceae bacterium]MBH2006164.1 ATP synthase F1 subunit gamma [Myxococcaceae bacterium]